MTLDEKRTRKIQFLTADYSAVVELCVSRSTLPSRVESRMSHSFRHNPFCGNTTSGGEKQEKRQANRLLRRRVRQKIGEDSDDPGLPVLREVSDIWSMSKDGKSRFRKAEYPELMRK